MNNRKSQARHAACLAYLEELRREEEARRRGWAYILVNSMFSWRPYGDRKRRFRRDRQLIEQAVCEIGSRIYILESN